MTVEDEAIVFLWFGIQARADRKVVRYGDYFPIEYRFLSGPDKAKIEVCRFYLTSDCSLVADLLADESSLIEPFRIDNRLLASKVHDAVIAGMVSSPAFAKTAFPPTSS